MHTLIPPTPAIKSQTHVQREVMRVNMAHITFMHSTTTSNLGSATEGGHELGILICSASISLIYLTLVIPSGLIFYLGPVLYSPELLFPLEEKVSQSKGMASMPTILDFLLQL